MSCFTQRASVQCVSSCNASGKSRSIVVRRGLHGEPRPVHRQHRLPRHRARLRRHEHRRRCPGSSTPTRSSSPRCSCPPAAGPTRSAASAVFLAGLGDLHRRQRGLCARPVGRAARRRARRAGRRRRAAAADLARADAARVRAARAPGRDRHLGRHRRHRRGRRPAARRRCSSRPTGAGSSSSTCPIGLVALDRRLRAPCARSASPARAAPTCSARCCSSARSRALIVAIVQGREWGWDSPRRHRRRPSPASLLFAGVVQRSLTHHSPVVDPAMVRVRGFTLAVSASIAFFVGFAAMLLGGRAVPDERLARERADRRA